MARGEQFVEWIKSFPVLADLQAMLNSTTRSAAKRGSSSKENRSFPDTETAKARIAG